MTRQELALHINEVRRLLRHPVPRAVAASTYGYAMWHIGFLAAESLGHRGGLEALDILYRRCLRRMEEVLS